jgi:hypothetical protein
VDAGGVEHDDGIPAGSSFQSLTGSGVTYLIQPAINANILSVGNPGNTGGTRVGSGVEALVLVNPAPYSKIAILAFGGNAGGCNGGADPCLLNVVINYSDGSGLTAQYHSEDWCVGASTATRMPIAAIPTNPSMNAFLPDGTPVTSIGRTGGGISASGSNGFSYGGGCTPLGFEAYETIINTDNTKSIDSLIFMNPAGSNVDFSNIVAVSGTP